MTDPEEESSLERLLGSTLTEAQVRAMSESMENAIRRARDTAIRRKMPQWSWDNLEWADADVVGSPGADDHQDFWDSLWDPGVWEVERNDRNGQPDVSNG